MANDKIIAEIQIIYYFELNTNKTETEWFKNRGFWLVTKNKDIIEAHQKLAREWWDNRPDGGISFDQWLAKNLKEIRCQKVDAEKAE